MIYYKMQPYYREMKLKDRRNTKLNVSFDLKYAEGISLEPEFSNEKSISYAFKMLNICKLQTFLQKLDKNW